MRTFKCTIIFLMLASGVPFAADEPSAEKKSYDRYKVIYEQNVFSKDRLPPRQPDSNSPQVHTTTTLSIYILRGIAAEAERKHKYAFIEEQISGESKTAGIGTTILGGRIKDIQLNYVLFEESGKTRKIRIGEEFGKTSTTVIVNSVEPVDINQPSDNVSPREDKINESQPTDENELLKKLIERREQELGTQQP